MKLSITMTDLTTLSIPELVAYTQNYKKDSEQLTEEIDQLEKDIESLLIIYNQMKEGLGIEGEYVLKDDDDES